ncbi:MAG: TIM barrel protein [Opitutaceae bacterium]|nr:TIM barrel protein [Cytophagales bacterium]
MNSRRIFLKNLGIISGGFALANTLPFSSFGEINKFDFQISLAEWSLHKALFSKKITNLDFPAIAKKKYDINIVEYVSQFFPDKAKDQSYLKELKRRCDDNGVKSHLIMVDQEGSLAATDKNERNKAIENHYKWVEAAKYLDCNSVRVNLHGEGNEIEWKEASIDSLTKLVSFASKMNINIIVENHGQWSSKGYLVAEVMKGVNHKNCGTLPDFGNFCVRREKGDLWESPCIEWYDRYKGIEEMLPYAKGISAKSFDFDAAGNETKTDFEKMFKIIQSSGFHGIIGVEYEGENMSEEEGIKATKKLLEKIKLNN